MTMLSPADVRYIKLGPSGAWLSRCLEEGTLELSYREAPHDLAAAGDWAAVEAKLRAASSSQGAAKDAARQVQEFYTAGADTLWVTIGNGRLWWAFAQAQVEPLTGEGRGRRLRRTVDGWHGDDLTGAPLSLSTLSTRLTKVAAYRQTICTVGAKDYLLRRINGIEEPAVIAAREARAASIKAAAALIEVLDWRDFELLTDLIFAASGWRRASAVGGSDQADTDLIFEQPTTGERAFVQVKSAADAAVLRDYVTRFRADPTFQRMFFVCHSPRGDLAEEPGVHVWLGDRLAEQAIKAGLLDWLIEKAR